MKSRRKLTAIVMAAAMMMTMVPSAFAAETDEVSQPTTITFPNGDVRDIPDVRDFEAQQPFNVQDTNTVSAQTNVVYNINSVNDFNSIPTNAWYQNNTFNLNCDLNLAQLNTPEEWYGYIAFFKGTFNGNGHKIYGFANNTYFIYAMIGGNINNLEIELSGNAGALIGAPGTDGQTPVRIVLDDITTTGYVNLTNADQSNYSPFIYCSGQGGLTMQDCTNEAEIKGNIYGSIFHGYYPLYVETDSGNEVTYVFDNCDNKADVTMQNAAMFFGNPNTIENNLNNNKLKVTIINCDNDKTIRGTVSSHYYAPSLNGKALTGKMLEEENKLTSTATDNTNSLSTEQLTVGEEPTNFTYTINDKKSISINEPADTSDISYYIVSVSSYYSLYWDNENIPVDDRFGGTNRYSVTERISASDLDDYGVTLKYYGIADPGYGQSSTSIACLDQNNNYIEYEVQDVDGNMYYTLPRLTSLVDGKYQRYAKLVDGVPVSGTNEPAFVNVTAFDADGYIVGFAKEATDSEI